MGRHIWTQKEIDTLKQLYPNTRTDIIASNLGLEIYKVYGKANALGLKKSEQFLLSPDCGRLYKGHVKGYNTRFKKGQIPQNKGKKMSPEQYEKCSKTMFKKGNKPHNTKFDGCLSIRRDKRTNRAYLYIRLSEGKWDEYHRYLWEKENGKIPEGFKLVFKDGNTSNMAIDNLELVSDQELMRRNTIHRYPDDLKSAIIGLRKLKKQLYGSKHDG